MDAAWKARLTDPGKPGSQTERDFNTVRTEIAAIKTPDGEALGKDRNEFFKHYAASIDGAMDLSGHSALGSQKVYEAQMDARRQEAALKQKGINPHELYDPASPNFFGKSLSKYHVSLQDAMNYQTQLGKNTNLTGPGKQTTGQETVEIPAGMSPAEAMKKYPGQTVRLPDGREKTLPALPMSR